MGRWVWHSSSGRRRPARSRACSRDTSRQIDRDPVLIVPNRSDVERIERDLLAAHRSAARGLDRDVRRRLPRARARRSGCEAGRERRAAGARRAPRARAHAAERPRPVRPASPASPTRSSRCSPSSSRACWTRSSSTAISPSSTRRTGPSSTGSGSGIATCFAAPGRRAAALRAGRLGRPARVRVRVRGSDRRRVGTARGAHGARGGHGLAAVRAGARRLRVAAPHAGGPGALAAGSIEDLPARSAEYGHAALAHLERHLFADTPPAGPALDGAIRFFEGAGARGSLELVAEDVRELAAGGCRSSEIALVVPSVERWRAPLETVLGTLGIPFAIEGRVRLGQTPFGQALLSLLRFEWQLGGRRELYAFLRSPYSGFARSNVDFLEGRLRGRGVSTRECVEEETIRLRDGQPLPPLEALRGAAEPARGGPATGDVDAAARARARCAARRRGEPRRPARVRVADARSGRARRLARARRRPRHATRCSARSSTPRCGSARRASAAAWPCSISPASGRAASTPSSCSGSRRGRCRAAAPPPRSSTTTRAASSTTAGGPAHAARPGRARALPLLHRLHARDGAPDARPRGGHRRGQPARAEPVLGRGRGALRPRGGAPLDPPPAALPADLGARGCADRARAAARARAARCARAGGRGGDRDRQRLGAAAAPGARRVHARDGAAASARARRARGEDAVQRHRAGAVRGLLLGLVLRAPDLAAADRPEGRRDAARLGRPHDPAPLLRRPAARDRQRPRRRGAAGRGAGVPRRVPRGRAAGREDGDDRARAARARAEPAPRPRAARPRRGALAGAAPAAQVRGRVRLRAVGPRAAARPRPRRRDHALREDRPDRRRPGQRPRHRPGLQVGAHRPLGGARSRRSCACRSRSTCSSCATWSGSSRSAGSTGRSRASAAPAGCSAPRRRTTCCPGFAANDYLDEDAFWAQVEGARDLARGLAQRIRTGDVRHDPKGTDGCPAWCDLWRMCRIRRA